MRCDMDDFRDAGEGFCGTASLDNISGDAYDAAHRTFDPDQVGASSFWNSKPGKTYGLTGENDAAFTLRVGKRARELALTHNG